MSEIAYEARLILDRVKTRIQYHTRQRDRWNAEKTRVEEQTEAFLNGNMDEGARQIRRQAGHYELAREHEHINKLFECLMIQQICETVIEDAKYRVRFEHRGYKDGSNAGSNVFDGQMNVEASRKFLIGVRDGDPAYMDMIPSPSLGGEWAGDDTWDDIYIELSEIDPQDMPDDHGQDMYEAYCHSFQQGATDAMVKLAKISAGEI